MSRISNRVEASRVQYNQLFDKAKVENNVYELQKALVQEKERFEEERKRFEEEKIILIQQLEQRAKEIETQYAEIHQKQTDFTKERETVRDVNKKISQDKVLELKIRELERKLDVTFPDDPEQRLQCFKDIVFYLKKMAFRKNDRRLFLFICATI